MVCGPTFFASLVAVFPERPELALTALSAVPPGPFLRGGVLVGALAQHLEREDRALRRVRRISSSIVRQPAVLLRLGEAALRFGGVGPKLLKPLAMIFRDMLGAPAQGEHHVLELMRGPDAVLGQPFGRVHRAKG